MIKQPPLSLRVMVLSEGHIAEFDTPNSLLDDPTTIFSSMMADAGLQGKASWFAATRTTNVSYFCYY